MILVNGEQTDCIPADDRGFAYGDGVFRTMAMRGGRVALWGRQYAKLAADCKAIDLAAPDDALLRGDLNMIAACMPDCALRITVTRGSGGRGYAIGNPAWPRRVVSAALLPRYPAEHAVRGVQVRYCRQRLALQPRLAGIKHLNRLENVLARAEWDDPAIAEGLLLDADGNIIEGTRCNLFLVESGTLVTPDLSRCGVAGVTRDSVIGQAANCGVACRIENVSGERLENADEILLVNSLIGVWPVAGLAGRKWSDFPVTRQILLWLDTLHDAPG
jgi:4-amino-4-deoxychorismate lyase